MSRADSLPELLAELVHRAYRLEAAERFLGLLLTRAAELPVRAPPTQGSAPPHPAEDDSDF